jgi:hypothetical protein
MRAATALVPLLAALADAVEPTNTVLRLAGRPVLEYRHGDGLIKPYAAQMFTPAGVAVLRDAPHDHLHHHGLMFAIAVDGVNFWEEVNGCGRQVEVAFTGGEDRLQQQLEWTDSTGKVRLRETRTVRLEAGAGITLASWTSVLSAPTNSAAIVLSGSHYQGLGARFVATMDRDAEFLFPPGAEGAGVRGTERLTPASWAAVTGDAGGRPVTFAVFNAGTAATLRPPMFTMTAPFAYLSSTLNLEKKPLELPPGEALALTYGVAIWDGRRDAAEIEKTYQDWSARRSPPE